MTVRVASTSAPSAVRALCIVNPAAGYRHASRDELPRAIERLEAAGFALEVLETGAEEPSSAQLARLAVERRLDAVIVAGGDGTVQPAAAELLDSGVALGILPFGSFMNIAHGLGLPLDAAAAADVITSRRVRAADVGDVDGRVFFESAGVGLDAEMFLAARLAERGRWANALRRVRRWATHRSHRLRVIVDGEIAEHHAYQVLIVNSPYYHWSMPVVPEASMYDGGLDVAVFPRMGRRALLGSMYALWRTGRPGRPPIVRRGSEISIESDEALSVHADGQVAGRLPVTIRCRAGALRVFAP